MVPTVNNFKLSYWARGANGELGRGRPEVCITVWYRDRPLGGAYVYAGYGTKWRELVLHTKVFLTGGSSELSC